MYNQQESIFPRQHTLQFTSKHRLTPIKHSALNPWTEHQMANPFLNTKGGVDDKKGDNKKGERKKIMSLEHSKSGKNFVNLQTKESTESNKVTKQLPKLNIGSLIRNETMRRKKIIGHCNTNASSKQYIFNNSPMYFSSPTLKKTLNNSTQLNRQSSKILPSVSRQLNITRKLYLLQNKLTNIKSCTASPTKRSFREDGGDIRRLVEKEWSKKV